MAQLVKNPPAIRRPGFDPWIGKTPGEGKGNSLHYPGLENAMHSSGGHKESDTTERLSLSLFPYLNLISVAAAAAKSLQSCPTLCDPIDGSPPGFPIPGIL